MTHCLYLVVYVSVSVFQDGRTGLGDQELKHHSSTLHSLMRNPQIIMLLDPSTIQVYIPLVPQYFDVYHLPLSGWLNDWVMRCCVCVCVYIYICVPCMCICVYSYICVLCMCLFLCLPLFVFVPMSISIPIFVFVSMFASTSPDPSPPPSAWLCWALYVVVIIQYAFCPDHSVIASQLDCYICVHVWNIMTTSCKS